MEAWNSFLQTVFQFVKSLFANVSKKMHRNAAVLTTGVAVVTVIAFTAGDFHGGGRNALVAFAETPGASSPAEAELRRRRLPQSRIWTNFLFRQTYRKRQNMSQRQPKLKMKMKP